MTKQEIELLRLAGQFAEIERNIYLGKKCIPSSKSIGYFSKASKIAHDEWEKLTKKAEGKM
jgi:hypothetical protein